MIVNNYVNDTFQTFLENHGIVHQATVPWSPAQNEVSESANRTIVDKARGIMQGVGLSRKF